MKVYITPVENHCNAHCTFCITRSKNESQYGTILDTKNLKQFEKIKDVDCFEISGGGEPLLHPKINQILDWCTKRKPTVLYTNGSLLKRLDIDLVKKLKKLTISQHHYLSSKRREIMGVSLDIKTLEGYIKNGVFVRFTLVLVKNGIKNSTELCRYLDWAEAIGVKEVQIRQLFDYAYDDEIKSTFVSTDKILQDISTKYHLKIKNGKYKSILWKGMTVEFEGNKCACADGVPNLRANGLLYQGWSNLTLQNYLSQNEPSAT